jgi:predicted naringenin-chalcone synthase
MRSHPALPATMDYQFFDDELQQRFTDQLQSRSIDWRVRDDVMGGQIVSLPDDLPDTVLDELETEYEALLDEQSLRAENIEGWVEKRLAGVQVNLPDGRQRTIALSPELANRLLAHFTAEEVAELVNAVAASLSHDFNGPICCFPEEK